MDISKEQLLYKASRLLIFVLAIATALYALNLLLVGQQLMTMQEGSTEIYVSYEPAPMAIWPLIASIVLVTGLVLKFNMIAWTGWLLLTLFSALFLFSIGGILLPVSAALLPLLVIIQSSDRAHKRGD